MNGMVPVAAVYAIIGGTFLLVLTSFVAMTKLVGDRIGDLRTDMQVGFGRIDAELAALRGAVVDLGQRVTRLESRES